MILECLCLALSAGMCLYFDLQYPTSVALDPVTQCRCVVLHFNTLLSALQLLSLIASFCVLHLRGLSNGAVLLQLTVHVLGMSHTQYAFFYLTFSHSVYVVPTPRLELFLAW